VGGGFLAFIPTDGGCTGSCSGTLLAVDAAVDQAVTCGHRHGTTTVMFCVTACCRAWAWLLSA